VLRRLDFINGFFGVNRWGIVGAKRPGCVADALLGISGGFAMFFLLDMLAIHVQDVNLILFAV
jgi:uncharacterized membrane protein YeaQ/YmgE (transglycosylase-associated protein family)